MAADTNSRLEGPQAGIKLETGRTVTQQELLARLADRANESRGEFTDWFDEDFDGWSRRDSRRDGFAERDPNLESGTRGWIESADILTGVADFDSLRHRSGVPRSIVRPYPDGF